MNPIVEGTGPHKYASTQLNFTGEAKRAMLAAARRIRSEDLGEEGRETEPHVTVQYGIEEVNEDCDKNVENLSKALTGYGSIVLRLGKTKLFQPEGKDAVVWVEVIPADNSLLGLRRKVRKCCKVTDTYPTYTPHATLAYVKAGAAKRYEGKDWCEGIEIECRSLVFSDCTGRRTLIDLSGVKESLRKAIGELP